MKSSSFPLPLQRRQFASDNYAGIAPEAWAALAQANSGHSLAYGEDAWTARAADLLRELFEIDCEVFFTFNGTAANSLALSSLCQSYHGIICHELAHIETDECGGPEFFSNGTKILLVGGAGSKIDPSEVERTIKKRTDIHYPKPRVISLTQPTEMGTVYTLSELDLIAEVAQRWGLRLHMDGARFANAIATLNISPKEITWKVGVDVLCLGGTKMGMPMGEAVIFFNKNLAEEFEYRCKQAGQLASKMRFLAAPWVGMLETGAWLQHAQRANDCAKTLASALASVPGVTLLAPCEANGVFCTMPEAMINELRDRGWHFYTFIGMGGVRFMCAWDTTSTDIEDLMADIQDIVLTISST